MQNYIFESELVRFLVCRYILCQSSLIIKKSEIFCNFVFFGPMCNWVEVSSAKIEVVKARVSVEQSGEVV